MKGEESKILKVKKMPSKNWRFLKAGCFLSQLSCIPYT